MRGTKFFNEENKGLEDVGEKTFSKSLFELC